MTIKIHITREKDWGKASELADSFGDGWTVYKPFISFVGELSEEDAKNNLQIIGNAFDLNKIASTFTVDK